MSNYKSEVSVEEDQDTKQKMGRGKIQIKLIENNTNRQVTYSKRRNGILKKAEELSVLCDAKVSLIMIFNNNRLHEYLSPGLKTKDVIDMYQTTTGTDLWETQFKTMQQTLQQLQDKNYELRREISQRLGHDLNDLSFPELSSLENDMASSVDAIRQRKFHRIKTQTETTRKKVKSMQERNTALVHEIHARCEDPPYGLVDNNDGGYESAVAPANGASNLYTFRHHHSTHSALRSGGGSLITTSHSALHNGGGSFDSFDIRDLRLA